MPKKNNDRSVVSRRLKTIEGHLKKVIEMVEEGVYCMDILQQTSAIKNALKSAEAVLLEGHLHSCVIRDVKKGKKKSVDEILELFKKINK